MEYLVSNFGYIIAFLMFVCIVFVRYLLFAGIPYVWFYKLKKKRFLHKHIQRNYPTILKIKNEVMQSFYTSVVFGLLGLTIYFLKTQELTLIYTELSEYGFVYFFTSLLAMLLLHDAYFYWIHRIMHQPKLFAFFHSVHHQSRNPTPFTSFSFNISEAFLEAAIVPILVMILPLHPLTIFIFFNISLAFNVMGHLGFEFLPTWFLKNPILKWINTSTHHNLHHQKGTTNYGLYFNFWDTLMKTNHKKYEENFYKNSI